MSKYTFKRKEATNSETKQKNKIMNASASPEENTAIFKKPEKEPLHVEDDSVFLPFELEDEKPKKQRKKSGGFSFNGFKHKVSSKNEELEQLDLVSKVEDILKEDISVDEIKENLTNGKKIDLSDVFSEKKAVNVENDNKEEAGEDVPAEENDGENDTYEGLEETAIEEPDDSDPSLVYDSQESVENEEDDIYTDIDMGLDEPPIPHRPIKFKKEKKKEIREYNNPEEKEEFTELYRKKGQTALLALIATFVSTLALIYLETKHLPHPIWLMPGKYGILYLMLDLQFVFISAICILNSLIDGAVHLFSWKPNKNSIVFVTFIISVIQILLHLAFNKYSRDINLYSSVFSLCAVICALISYIDFRREHISFRVAASSKVKNVASILDNTSVEYEKFSEYLPEDASLYKISKTNFVSGFFKTNNRTSPYNEVYKITLPLVVLASVIFAILSLTIVKEATVCDAINNFTLALMMALPLSSLLVVSLPFFFTTLRLSRLQSAIIGEAAIEEYANTSLISFADVDVFHPKGIKITSIKTYGKSRIDNTYLVAAKVFNLLGGPLKEVFNRSVIATMNDLYADEIVSVSQSGVTASIENHKVYVGSGDYMESNGFAHIDDAIDSAFVNSNGRIMYIAIDDEVSAKFYIKYALGVNFKALLDSFNNLGICMAINTRDPNLDTKFITQILKDDTYPIVVVKNETLPSQEENKPKESESSGIVSASSVSNMLRTVLSADRLSRIISINTLAKCISLILAFTVIIVTFLADGSHEKITPLFIMLYQLVWSLPIVFTSIFG